MCSPLSPWLKGFERAGHTVTLTSHSTMRPLVEAHAVNFTPIGPNVDMVQETTVIRQ
jgi:UDP:flavonoid glycosyltransferase YjiC (YdhE family)